MIVPCNKHLLCKQIDDKKEDTYSEVTVFTDFKAEVLPEYEVVSSSSPDYQSHDKVVASSTGAKFEHEGQKLCLFTEDSIIGKIDEDQDNGQA